MATLAKISRPKLSGIHPRERLFDLLDRHRRQPVIWLCGPPGAGKTTLIGSYLEQRALPCLWYQVDEGDADIATFFYYLGLAANQAAPRKRKPLPLFTPEYLQGIPAFTRRYFQELYDRLKPPCAIVLDNYQEAPPNSVFHEVIRDALGEVPSGVTIFAASRAAPPAALARMRANGALELVDWEELRLTQDEAQSIVRLRKSEEVGSDVIERTQGWAAGLMLMLAGSKEFRAQSLDQAAPQELFDYFAGEIFQKTDRNTQDFLMETAFLPRITVALADALTAHRDAEAILSYLTLHNYFTTRHGHAQPFYQYHPLFREFLLAQARESLTAARRAALMNDAAGLLATAGQMEDAAELYRQVKDFKGLAHIVQQAAKSFIEQGRVSTIRTWLDALPQELIEASPWLLYWCGECRFMNHPDESRPYFERALELFRKQRDATGVFQSWIRVVSSIRFEPTADLRPLDRDIALFDELIKEYPQFPSPEIEVAATACLLLAFMMRQPQNPKMRDCEARAAALLQSGLSPLATVELGAFLMMYHCLVGDHAKATVELDLVSAAAAQTEIPVLLQLYRFLSRAHYFWMRSLFKENLDAVRAGLELARTVGVHVWDHQLLHSGLLGTLSSGNLTAAKELLELLRLRYPNWSMYHALASWYAFLCDDLALARTSGEVALQSSEKEGRPYFHTMRHIEMSHVYHRLGEFDKARYHRKQFMSLAHGTGSTNLLFPALLAEAQFASAECEPEKALEHLREALALGAEENITNHAWWQPKVMSRLCVEALKAGIEIDYVRKLIRTRNLIPESPPLDVENWPWEIRIVTLGRFEVQKNDHAIAFSRKAPKKPIALLKALVALGGQDVPERKLVDALWPDQEGDAAHEVLNVNLHRLRKLLEDTDAIQVQEGKLSLNPRQVWVDAWVFEKSLDAADAASGEERVRLLERALKLYRGAFLPEEAEEAWSVSYRERLRAKFIRHSAQLGAHWSQSGELELAVNCYLRGLEADDLAEELYQGLMRCYQQMNRRAEALAVYRRMRQTLSVILGVKPSPASEALYSALNAE